MEPGNLTSRQCPRCGKTLPPDAPEGLCASCLFSAGAETFTSLPSDDIPTLSSGRGVTPRLDEQRLEHGQTWGAYRIGRLLGRGGMGEVYEAEHAESGRRVALKVLRSRLHNSDDRARFLREGQLAASISHPHTVYIFGSEEISGMPVISMELLGGGTLKDRVATNGPMPPVEAVSAVLDIIGGLDAAQAAGILHRDIKPSNCFLDNEGNVKVGDFGLSISTLARDVHHDFETTGFQGTPQFAAPEQLRGEPLDVRADIYAVGATLYYLLTGRPPFDARDLRELLLVATKEEAKSPRLLQPRIPQGLASVVLRCLAKDPARRPASYAALAGLLRPFAVREDAPANPGLRILAAVIDGIIVSVPVSIAVLSSGNVINETPQAVQNSVAWTFLVNFVYFVTLEGFWGTSLGKKMFGLRIASVTGSPPSFLQILCRTAIFFAPNLLLALASGLIFISNEIRSIVALSILLGSFALTARRSNGWAALHEVFTGTRVISRALKGARTARGPIRIPALESPARTQTAHYGPFIASSEGFDTGSGRLFPGFDPVLRRPVWIHSVEPGTPAVGPARRNIGRSGRLFWLTGRRSDDENWDAFEAPDGEALLARERSLEKWGTVKLWLMDLSKELVESGEEGSAPELGLDRLWIRNDGRIVLLDFRAPKTSPTMPANTPVELLSSLSAHTMSGVSGHAGSEPLPLSAHTLLQRWTNPQAVSVNDAQKQLERIVATPDKTPRWKRAVPMLLAATPTLFVLMVTLAILPALFQFLGRYGEMIGLLEILHEPNPPAGSAIMDPKMRDSVERYLVGRYGTTLRDDTFWKGNIMQSLRDRRAFANEILARHPSASEEEASQLAVEVAPVLRRVRQNRNAPAGTVGMGTAIAGGLGALSLLLVIVLSAVSSVIVPGGLVTRLMGLAVVTQDGAEISRACSLVRVFVTWLPAILWLAVLLASEKIAGWFPAPAALPWGTGLAMTAMIAGALWTLVTPPRGPQDRLVKTWVVPR